MKRKKYENAGGLNLSSFTKYNQVGNSLGSSYVANPHAGLANTQLNYNKIPEYNSPVDKNIIPDAQPQGGGMQDKMGKISSAAGIWGQVYAIGNNIGNQIRTKAEETDSNGFFKDSKAVRNAQVATNFMQPEKNFKEMITGPNAGKYNTKDKIGAVINTAMPGTAALFGLGKKYTKIREEQQQEEYNKKITEDQKQQRLSALDLSGTKQYTPVYANGGRIKYQTGTGGNSNTTASSSSTGSTGVNVFGQSNYLNKLKENPTYKTVDEQRKERILEKERQQKIQATVDSSARVARNTNIQDPTRKPVGSVSEFRAETTRNNTTQYGDKLRVGKDTVDIYATTNPEGQRVLSAIGNAAMFNAYNKLASDALDAKYPINRDSLVRNTPISTMINNARPGGTLAQANPKAYLTTNELQNSLGNYSLEKFRSQQSNAQEGINYSANEPNSYIDKITDLEAKKNAVISNTGKKKPNLTVAPSYVKDGTGPQGDKYGISNSLLYKNDITHKTDPGGNTYSYQTTYDIPSKKFKTEFLRYTPKVKKSYGGPYEASNGGKKLLTIYKNGGTHQESSIGGIPVGKNALVEEGEVKYGNFIFSNRLGK